MRNILFVGLLFFVFIACSDDGDGGGTPPTGFTYEEIVAGELSDDHTSPSGPFNFVVGNNTVTADQQGAPVVDVDYFTFVIQPGQQLSQLIVQDYAAATNNTAFIGLQQGSSFSNDAANTTADQLLGGFVYGAVDLNDNILPKMAQLTDAIGFTSPLAAGTYTIWLNQTGGNSTVRLNFVVN